MNPRDLAQKLAYVTVIHDRAAELKDELRTDLVHALDAVGADSAKAETIAGDKVAKVTIIEKKDAAKVLQDDLFTAWVKANRPTEIVESVRPSFAKAFLDTLKPGPDGAAIDPATGEIVPGIRFTPGARYASLRFDAEGRAQVAASLLRDGLPVGILATPQLEAPHE